MGSQIWGGGWVPIPWWMWCTYPPNRMTDTCESITFPQLRWRAVKSCKSLKWTLTLVHSKENYPTRGKFFTCALPIESSNVFLTLYRTKQQWSDHAVAIQMQDYFANNNMLVPLKFPQQTVMWPSTIIAKNIAMDIQSFVEIPRQILCQCLGFAAFHILLLYRTFENGHRQLI